MKYLLTIMIVSALSCSKDSDNTKKAAVESYYMRRAKAEKDSLVWSPLIDSSVDEIVNRPESPLPLILQPYSRLLYYRIPLHMLLPN